VRRADKLTTFIVPTVLKFGSLNLLEPSGLVQACNGTVLPFTRPYANTAHFCALSSPLCIRSIDFLKMWLLDFYIYFWQGECPSKFNKFQCETFQSGCFRSYSLQKPYHFHWKNRTQNLLWTLKTFSTISA